MKLRTIIAATMLAASAISQAADFDPENLYASWCLTGMSQTLDGTRAPDKATYTFTRDHRLQYDAGFFKQEGKFSIEGNKIKTSGLGNYRVVSIKGFDMVLNYGGFLFFTKGACN